jgi:DNA-binding MarR family transcriptional regulator
MDWKKYSKIEKVTKGAGHRRRIAVLFLLYREPRLSLSEISDKIRTDYKNTSQHLQKMAQAGLVKKENEGNIMRHTLTPLGKKTLKAIRNLSV